MNELELIDEEAVAAGCDQPFCATNFLVCRNLENHAIEKEVIGDFDEAGFWHKLNIVH
jgi:hypothetical protein